MQPDDQPQYSIDYLDQISTAPKKPTRSEKLFPIVIIAGIVIALLVGVMALFGSGTSNKDEMARLATRLKTLQSIADTSQKTIKSGSLRGTNTNLSLLLTNANRDIKEPLKNNAVDTSKLNPAIAKQEDGSELKDRLEDARLNAVFDRTYAREMSYQLETLAALMKEIDKNTKSRSLKEFLATTLDQVEPIRQQFADFDSAAT